MSTKVEMEIFQAAMAQPASEQTRAQDLFNKQKAYFASDATKTHEWKVEQLNRLIRMLKENYERFTDASRGDFKTASQENVFEVSATIATAEFAKSQVKEWMKPVEAPLPELPVALEPSAGVRERCRLLDQLADELLSFDPLQMHRPRHAQAKLGELVVEQLREPREIARDDVREVQQARIFRPLAT